MTDGTSDTSETPVDPSEPSMEDILASIRQLIADDDASDNEAISDTETVAAVMEQGEISDFAEPQEPLELTTPLDDFETTFSDNGEALSAVEHDVMIPEIEVGALDLTSHETSGDEIDIPVQSLIDDIMGVDVEASALPDLTQEDDGGVLNDLMGDMISDRDIEPSQPGDVPSLNIEDLLPSFEETVPAETLGVKDEVIINNNDDDLADALLSSNDEEIGSSIDDILSTLSNDIDMIGEMDESDALLSSEESLKRGGDAIPDAGVSVEGSGDEFGQDFDSLMAEFTAEDDTQTDLDTIMEDFLPTENAAVEQEVVAASDMSTGNTEMDNLLDDMLAEASQDEGVEKVHADVIDPVNNIDDVASGTANIAGDDVPEMDDIVGNEDIESILAGFNDDETSLETGSIFELSEDENDTIAVEGPQALPEMSDPDIELVKSLMAELTDTGSDFEGEESDAIEDNNGLEITSQQTDITHDSEGDILEDLLSDTLASEETLQADIQLDINNQVEAITGESESSSSLSELADMMSADDSELEPNSEQNLAGTAIATGGLMAAVMAQTADSKPSALDVLMSDEGAAVDMSDLSVPQMSEAVAEGETELEEILSSLIDDTVIDSEDELMVDPVSLEDSSFEMDDLISDIVDEAPAVIETDSSIDDINLGEALVGLIDDAPNTEPDQQSDVIETNTDEDNSDFTSDLDFIEDLLSPEPSETLDPAPETLNIISETSELEIEDMAVKSARETILDEVTETAAASAFASLNQVVEEKAVVAERGDRIGDLVTAALEPMLKEWLDANLKGIVERAVQKEVKRISSGK